jgi:hypothetical protein
MPRQAEVPSPYESLFDLAGAIMRLQRRNHVAGAGTVKTSQMVLHVSARSSLEISTTCRTWVKMKLDAPRLRTLGGILVVAPP